MLTHYLKIALRNLARDKFYSTINILGLAVGIAVALLIGLYCYHELSFDRFHGKADRTYRIAMHLEVGGNIADMNSTFPPMAEAMQHEIPEVETAIRLYIQNGRVFKRDDKVFTEDKVLFADPQFFSVFDLKILAGDGGTALREKNTVMLTPTLAAKYFDSKPFIEIVGKTILINQQEFQVTGVVEEAPANSHFLYSAIASIESIGPGRDKAWDNLNVSTYFVLRNDASLETVMEKVDGVFKNHLKNYDNHAAQGLVMKPFAQRMTDIHLRSDLQGEFEPNNSTTNVFIFITVGIVVLLLASVNFVNLVTARSANRAKEVGIRKVLGSASQRVMRQFILESFILVGFATLLALGLVELIRTPFDVLVAQRLPFHLLLTPQAFMWIAAFVLVIGLLAGSYPAFYLSSFQPAQVLKGKTRAGSRGSGLRNVLVIFQFVISITLITCTLIVQHQLNFMRSKKLGFDKENVLIIDNTNRLASQQAFVNAVKMLPGVDGVGAATSRPIDDYDGMMIETERDKGNRKLVNFAYVDHDYLQVLKYEFVEGRNFSREFPSDSSAVVINERAAQFLFENKALGENLINDRPYKVVGIVKDFNFESLKNDVRPLVFYLHPNQRFLHVRVQPGDYSAVIASLEKTWKGQTDELPFSYSFLNDNYNKLFKEEVKLGMLFGLFTTLALGIACLGLIGLAAYMAEQRKKEISVRKVLGASVAQMIYLLSVDFGKLICFAFVISVPIGYYLMDRWLMGFAFRADIPATLIVAGGMIVIIVAFVTVPYQAVKAALLNPVEALKDE